LIRSALCTSGELAELDELAKADAELSLFVASFASIWASFASNALTVSSMVFPFTKRDPTAATKCNVNEKENCLPSQHNTEAHTLRSHTRTHGASAASH